jgi:phospholipase C
VASRRWYDLTVTSEADPAFLRRFAGHVENGQPGVSDPAIITG